MPGQFGNAYEESTFKNTLARVQEAYLAEQKRKEQAALLEQLFKSAQSKTADAYKFATTPEQSFGMLPTQQVNPATTPPAFTMPNLGRGGQQSASNPAYGAPTANIFSNSGELPTVPVNVNAENKVFGAAQNPSLPITPDMPIAAQKPTQTSIPETVVPASIDYQKAKQTQAQAIADYLFGASGLDAVGPQANAGAKALQMLMEANAPQKTDYLVHGDFGYTRDPNTGVINTENPIEFKQKKEPKSFVGTDRYEDMGIVIKDGKRVKKFRDKFAEIGSPNEFHYETPEAKEKSGDGSGSDKLDFAVEDLGQLSEGARKLELMSKMPIVDGKRVDPNGNKYSPEEYRTLLESTKSNYFKNAKNIIVKEGLYPIIQEVRKGKDKAKAAKAVTTTENIIENIFSLNKGYNDLQKDAVKSYFKLMEF